MTFGSFLPYLLFLLAGVSMIFAGLRIRSKATQSRHWPTTAGRILSLEFDDSMDPDGSVITYQTNIEYAYTVHGVEYVSSRIAFGFSAGPSRQFQFALYTRFKQADGLVVHYNPAKPSEAVLDISISASGSKLISAGAIWLAATLGFFVLDFLSASRATH